MNPFLKAVQDKAWDVKDVCDTLEPRKLSAGDESTLRSVHRDKRKRGGGDADDGEPEQAEAPRVQSITGNGNVQAGGLTLVGGDHAD